LKAFILIDGDTLERLQIGTTSEEIVPTAINQIRDVTQLVEECFASKHKGLTKGFQRQSKRELGDWTQSIR
jgi:hypothetical protein